MRGGNSVEFLREVVKFYVSSLYVVVGVMVRVVARVGRVAIATIRLLLSRGIHRKVYIKSKKWLLQVWSLIC